MDLGWAMAGFGSSWALALASIRSLAPTEWRAVIGVEIVGHLPASDDDSASSSNR
jgi:hypothetical protein